MSNSIYTMHDVLEEAILGSGRYSEAQETIIYYEFKKFLRKIKEIRENER